ncbi:MAG: hypothetical protein UEP80_00585 [Senegalimassilia anaerobia]|nr:hypothetical protein [Senegalimassilia anaerobia]
MANFQLLVLDEWLEKPDEGFRAFILEVMEGDSRRPPRSSARSSSKRTGMTGSAAASTPTASWTASSTTPRG